MSLGGRGLARDHTLKLTLACIHTLVRVQERLRVVIEDEERRREEARILLKTYPRRSSPVPGIMILHGLTSARDTPKSPTIDVHLRTGRPSISRRSATTGLSSGGGANGTVVCLHVLFTSSYVSCVRSYVSCNCQSISFVCVCPRDNVRMNSQ
jgi:hypothetical protein